MPLISLTEAKQHLRVDDSAEDGLITMWIGAAEQAAANFLNRAIYESPADMAADDTGVVANDAIKAAILLILGDLYAHREDTVATSGVAPVTLPQGSTWLLQPYRTGLGA